MEKGGADRQPLVAAVTGTLEEKNTSGDKDEPRPASATTRSPAHDPSRGLLPELPDERRPEGGDHGIGARERAHSSESDSDISAVDSDEEEVRAVPRGAGTIALAYSASCACEAASAPWACCEQCLSEVVDTAVVRRGAAEIDRSIDPCVLLRLA